jgi:outer membrane protein OmpA-like peptidoglycan-associated protein
VAAAAQPPAAVRAAPAPRTPRQADWAKRLGAAERFVVEDVAFEPRTPELLREAGLADLAAALLAEPSASVRLEGFVDATGDRAADQKLSLAMARAVADGVVRLGIPRRRVTFDGRGGESPRLPNFTVRGRAANRRVEAVGLR